jgi:hypothetical protein
MNREQIPSVAFKEKIMPDRITQLPEPCQDSVFNDEFAKSWHRPKKHQVDLPCRIQ